MTTDMLVPLSGTNSFIDRALNSRAIYRVMADKPPPRDDSFADRLEISIAALKKQENAAKNAIQDIVETKEATPVLKNIKNDNKIENPIRPSNTLPDNSKKSDVEIDETKKPIENKADELEKSINNRDKKDIIRDAANLSDSQKAKVLELKRIDAEVKAHEQQHLAAAGGYATSGAQLSFVQGPDGKRYAVAGEVSIDSSSENSPELNLTKARIIKRAALAPANPSSADRSVAAAATQMEAQAAQELLSQRMDLNSKPLVKGNIETDNKPIKDDAKLSADKIQNAFVKFNINAGYAALPGQEYKSLIDIFA